MATLICSKQLTREEAIIELSKPIYDSDLLRQDYDFVVKKLGLTKVEFEKIMSLPPKAHTAYPVEKDIYMRYPILKIVRPFWLIIKSLLKNNGRSS